MNPCLPRLRSYCTKCRCTDYLTRTDKSTLLTTCCGDDPEGIIVVCDSGLHSTFYVSMVDGQWRSGGLYHEFYDGLIISSAAPIGSAHGVFWGHHDYPNQDFNIYGLDYACTDRRSINLPKSSYLALKNTATELRAGEVILEDLLGPREPDPKVSCGYVAATYCDPCAKVTAVSRVKKYMKLDCCGAFAPRSLALACSDKDGCHDHPLTIINYTSANGWKGGELYYSFFHNSPIVASSSDPIFVQAYTGLYTYGVVLGRETKQQLILHNTKDGKQAILLNRGAHYSVVSREAINFSLSNTASQDSPSKNNDNNESNILMNRDTAKAKQLISKVIAAALDAAPDVSIVSSNDDRVLLYVRDKTIEGTPIAVEVEMTTGPGTQSTAELVMREVAAARALDEQIEAFEELKKEDS